MATNEQSERAINYIRDNAKKFADAKANRVYIEQFRKTKKAILMQQAPLTCKTIADKESYAYSHDEYLELLVGLKDAVQIEEELKYHFAAANLKFQQWQTMEATEREERRRYAHVQ